MTPLRRLPWIAASILLAGITVAALLVKWLPPASPMTRLSVALEPLPGGLSPEELQGLRVVLAACVEAQNHLAISEWEKLGPGALPTAKLKLGARRMGDQLQLEGQLVREDGQRSTILVGPGSFRNVFSALIHQLGLNPEGASSLLPKESEGAWAMVRILSYLPAQSLPPLQDVLRRALDREPDCPLLWGALALATHVDLANGTSTDPMELQRCDAQFRKALALAPRTPLLVYLYSFFKAETGDVSEAMDLAFDAVPYKPHSLYLRAAQDYAARQAGHLEGARRALAAMKGLVGEFRWFGNSVTNTWLYSGEWQRFEDSLGVSGPREADPYLDFYRGYIRMLRGRQDEALVFFARCGRNPGAPGDFARLGHVYQLHLQGEPGLALEALRTLQASRPSQVTTDGELTFKQAEAFAMLNAEKEAFQSLEMAVSQGFTCFRWYEESPFLMPLHQRPEWKQLRKKVQALQTRFIARYPSERFGV